MNRQARSLRAHVLSIPFLLLTTVLLVVLFYAASVHAFAGNSDGATVVLEGVALRHGQLTLGGWSLSLDSFWSVDAIFYAGAALIGGLRTSYLHLVPALLGALTVIVCIILACKGTNGRTRLVAGAVILTILAVPSHALSFFFLQGPWHVGTVLYCLLAFLALSTGRFGWPFYAGVVLLAAGLLGDLQTLAFGVVPVFLAGLTAALRTRSLRRAAPTILAAPASLALAVLIRLIAAAIGTFRVEESHHTVSLIQFRTDFGHLLNWGAALVGIRPGPFGGPAIPRYLELPHVLTLGVLAAAVISMTTRLLLGCFRGNSMTVEGSETWRLDDLLVIAFFASIGTFELLTLSNNITYARYLNAVVVFGAILAARWVVRLWSKLGRVPRAISLLAWIAVLASSIGVLATDLSASTPKTPTAALEQFLTAHDLHEGIGDYWAASVVTVDTRGKIKIRPVVANLKGKIVADGRQATTRWYRGKKFSFLVYQKAPYGRVDEATVVKTFGPPAHVYPVGTYSVLVWSHPITLGPSTFP